MPTNKDFKRLVRSRMQKTGESYTAARTVLLRRPAASPPAPARPDYAALAGMADEKVKARTGCTWEKWVWALDRVEAHRWPHREIARYITETWKLSSWWSQTVTVGYERIRGLRVRGQRRDGGYSVTRSKTVALPVSKLYRAFEDGRVRAGWLPRAAFKVRTRIKDRSIRLTWSDGTLVVLGFRSAGPTRSQISIQQEGLTNQTDAERQRVFWGERLEALADTSGRIAKR